MGAQNSSVDLVLEFFKDDSFHIQDLKGDECRVYSASRNMETMQYSNFDRTSSPAYALSQKLTRSTCSMGLISSYCDAINKAITPTS